MPFAPSARTDHEGTFVLNRVGEGVWGLIASAPGTVGWRACVRAGARDVAIETRPAHDVVISGFEPALRGTAVSFLGIDVPFCLDLEIGADGSLTIPSVPAGRFSLESLALDKFPTVELSDESPRTLRVVVPAPSTPSGPRVTGTVHGMDGKPCAGARVGLFVNEHGHFLSLVSSLLTTDTEGRFDLRGIAHLGDSRLRVVGVQGDSVGASAPCRAGETVNLVLDRQSATLSVKVVEADSGEPLVGATVGTLGVLVTGEQDRSTDGTGRIPTLRGLLPPSLLGKGRSLDGLSDFWIRRLTGAVELRVAAPPWHLPAVRRLLVGERDEVTIALARAPVRTGRVLDRRGQPVGGVRLRARSATCDTDPEGRFVLVGDRADANLEDLRWAPVPDWGPFERLPAMERSGTDLVIPDGRRWPLEVRVRPDFEGDSIQVTLPGSQLWPGPLAQGYVDCEGIALAGDILPGRYLVRLLKGGRVHAERQLVLSPDPRSGVWRVAPFSGDR